MADLVFGIVASPWLFFWFGALFTTSAVLGLFTGRLQASGDAVGIGLLVLCVLCWGFAAILWKLG